MRRSAQLAFLAVGALALGACEKNSEVPDPCGAGGCGGYQDPLANLDAESGRTVRQHSDAAGTISESEFGVCPLSPDEVPPLASLDSSSIPEFDGRRSRASNFRSGEGRLQDIDIHEQMMGVQGLIFECIDLAACYEGGESLSGGDLDFRFELSPAGKVMAVSVTPSNDLAHPGVVDCARRSLYELHFPSYDGAAMMVSYSMEIELQDAY
jgi:hypothetical protein